ncbi:MAG: YqhA family protein [Bacteroidota bacterium]
MKLQNIFGILLKFVSFLSVIGVIVLAIGVFFYSFYEIYKVIETILKAYSSEGEVILKALKAIDLVLLAVIFFIIGTGLFELFIRPIDNLPDWFHMKNIDQLKGMLIKVVIVVMGVSFTGRIVTWDGKTDLLGYGIGLGVVIFALSYFLRVKMEEKEEEKS